MHYDEAACIFAISVLSPPPKKKTHSDWIYLDRHGSERHNDGHTQTSGPDETIYQMHNRGCCLSITLFSMEAVLEPTQNRVMAHLWVPAHTLRTTGLLHLLSMCRSE